MASSQMIVSLTVADFENIVQRAVLSALSGKSVPSAPLASKKTKKEKKEKDPNAPKKAVSYTHLTLPTKRIV